MVCVLNTVWPVSLAFCVEVDLKKSTVLPFLVKRTESHFFSLPWRWYRRVKICPGELIETKHADMKKNWHFSLFMDIFCYSSSFMEF